MFVSISIDLVYLKLTDKSPNDPELVTIKKEYLDFSNQLLLKKIYFIKTKEQKSVDISSKYRWRSI